MRTRFTDTDTIWRQSGHFIPLFQPRSRSFYHGSCTSVKKINRQIKASSLSRMAHESNSTPAAGARTAVLTREEGRLQAEADFEPVFGIWVLGSCCCLEAEAATGAVGSLSNWVELELGPALQQRPRWFLLSGRWEDGSRVGRG